MKVIINNPRGRTKHNLSNITDDKNPGGVVDGSAGCTAAGSRKADRNVKFNRGKCSLLQLRKNNPMNHQQMLTVGKTLSILVNNRQNTGKKEALQQR